MATSQRPLGIAHVTVVPTNADETDAEAPETGIETSADTDR